MPLEAFAIQRLDALSSQDEPISQTELEQRLIALYADYQDNQDNQDYQATNTAENIVNILQKSLSKNPNNCIYLGMFNKKPIACMGVFDDDNNAQRRLQYLAIHPANRGRGIAKKFVKQVVMQERKKGVERFLPVDNVIFYIVQQYELN